MLSRGYTSGPLVCYLSMYGAMAGRLRFYLCCGRRFCLVGTGVKQGDPAGPLFFAVSTFELFESIQDAVEKLVAEQFPLMPSYVGVTAVYDDLKVTCDLKVTWSSARWLKPVEG